MKHLKEFNNKFNIHDLKIFETQYWIWSIRPHQSTLGSSILVNKRETTEFSGLSIDEMKDLNFIAKIIEKSLKVTFDYDKINYLSLMMIDPQFHFHIIPRYKNKRLFNGKEWIDEAWPKPPILNGEGNEEKELIQIIKEIKKNILRA